MAFSQVAGVLDPVLVPLGFAPGQLGAALGIGQAIFCRGDADSTDGGCIDLVIDLEATPEWHIVDVRYWGFPSDRWHLELDRDSELASQLSQLVPVLRAALT